MGFPNPAKEVKKYLGRAKKEITGTASSAKRSLEKTANNAKYSIESTANKARHSVEDIGSDIIREIKDESEEIIEDFNEHVEQALDSVEETAKEAVEETLQVMMRESTRIALNKAIDLAQGPAPDAIGLTVGPVGFEIDNIKERIDTFQKWALNPPDSKSDIKDIVLAFMPTHVQVGVDAKFAAFVVTSDTASISIYGRWNTESFIEKFDDIIKNFN